MAGTQEDDFFQTERFSYKIPVPVAKFKAVYHFAEMPYQDRKKVQWRAMAFPKVDFVQ